MSKCSRLVRSGFQTESLGVIEGFGLWCLGLEGLGYLILDWFLRFQG